MPVLSDADIAALILERKPLPDDYRERLRLEINNRHKRGSLDVHGDEGHVFTIMLRVAELNALDFSVILGVQRPGTSRLFHLRRYNGKAHEHANKMERTPPFYDYHIHYATERYQRTGSHEEHYAEVTDRYVDLPGAFGCLVADCGFVLPEDLQMSLIAGSLL